MKKLIWVLAFLLISSASANWVSESDLTAIKSDTIGVKVYRKKQKCESFEGEECYNITGKNPKYYTIQQVRKGDFEAATSVEDCADQESCESQIADPVTKCGDASYTALWGDIDSDGSEETPDLESWCARRALVNSLEEDTALKTTYESEAAKKATEKVTRETKSTERDNQLKQCVKVALKNVPDLDPQTATTNQLANRQNRLKDCLGLIIKEVISGRLDPKDL